MQINVHRDVKYIEERTIRGKLQNALRRDAASKIARPHSPFLVLQVIMKLMIYIRSNDIGRLQLVQRIIIAIISITNQRSRYPISTICN